MGLSKNSFLLLLAVSVLSFLVFLFVAREQYFYLLCMHIGLFAISMYFLFDKNVKTTLKKLGCYEKKEKIAVYAALGFVAIMAITLAVSLLAPFFGISDQANVAMIVGNLPLHVLIFAFLLAPIGEELFFRALLSNKIGVVLSSLAFAIAHAAYGSIAQLVAVFFMGIVLALAYRSSKSILPGIIIHGTFNFFSIMAIKVVGGY